MCTECGRSSGVEHNLAKVGVEGSNPFARSINLGLLENEQSPFSIHLTKASLSSSELDVKICYLNFKIKMVSE